MNKKLILVRSPALTLSGYGKHSLDVIKSLLKIFSKEEWDFLFDMTLWGSTPFIDLDIDDPTDKYIMDNLVKTDQLPKFPDIFLQISIPSEFIKFGKFSIGITAGTETSIASAEFLAGCNKMDLIIVPSKFTRDVLQSSSWQKKNQTTGIVEEEIRLIKPIEVLFEGYNENIFKKISSVHQSINDELGKIPEQFCFLAVGHWLKGDFGQDRKDMGMLIKTFLNTFKNRDVMPALILKTAIGSNSIIDQTAVLKKVDEIKKMVDKKDEKLPNIYLLYGNLSDEEMNSLYNHSKVKAMISFAHGEGFGRPLLEFSITGKPILAPNWSGQLDFLPNGNAILLRGKLEPIHESAVWDYILIKESSWFRVDYEYAAVKMELVFSQYGKYIEMGRKQANHATNFTFNKMTEKLDEIIKKYFLSSPPELKLPSLPRLTKISDLPNTEGQDRELIIPDLSKLKGFENINL